MNQHLTDLLLILLTYHFIDVPHVNYERGQLTWTPDAFCTVAVLFEPQENILCASVHYRGLCSASSSASGEPRVRFGKHSPALSSVSEPPPGGSLSPRNAPYNQTVEETHTCICIQERTNGDLLLHYGLNCTSVTSNILERRFQLRRIWVRGHVLVADDDFAVLCIAEHLEAFPQHVLGHAARQVVDVKHLAVVLATGKPWQPSGQRTL